MRIPIVPDISSRDGSSTKNGRMYNVLGEKRPNGDRFAVVRPGLTEVADTTGSGKGLVCWNGTLVAMYGTSALKAIQDFSITARTSPDVNKTWGRVAWNGTVFAAGAAIPTSTVAMTSPDAITWTLRTMPSSGNWGAIAWNGSVFCMINSGNATCATSPDGITWTSRTMPSASDWVSIEWNGSVFLALANGTIGATSPDGITWTARTVPDSGSLSKYALEWNGSVFCILCQVENFGQPSVVCATSADGITWTTGTAFAGSWRDMKWGGGYFVAVDEAYPDAPSGAILSSDGLNWESTDLDIGYEWKSIGWNGSYFLAAGVNIAAYSSNGRNWTYTSLPAGMDTRGIEWNGSIFAIVSGSSGKVASAVIKLFESIGTVSGTFFDFAQSPT